MKLFVLLFLLISIKPLFSKDNFAPNRPSQTNSPWVVPSNSLMIESCFEVNGMNLENPNYSFGLNEFRYGIGYNSEIKVTASIVKDVDTKFENFSLNYKYELVDSEGIIPSIGILANFGIVDRQGIKIDPGLKIIFRNLFENGFSFSYLYGFQSIQEYNLHSYTLNVGYNISQNLSIFIENYGSFNEFNNYGYNNFFDLGFAYLLNDRLQIDFYTGVNLNKEDFFFGNLGFAYLLN